MSCTRRLLHGQAIGRPPRRAPSHFEAGLERHAQPLNPRPTHKPAARGIVRSESQIDVNLKSHVVGDGSQGYALSPAVGQALPLRWTPARTTQPTTAVAAAAAAGSAPPSPSPHGGTMPAAGAEALPPSPLSLARAARALTG